MKSFFTKNKNPILSYTVLIIVSMIAVWWTFNYAINFSAFPIQVIYLLMYMAFFKLFDVHILKGIDLITEVKDGNIAVGLYVVAIAIIIHGVATSIG